MVNQKLIPKVHTVNAVSLLLYQTLDDNGNLYASYNFKFSSLDCRENIRNAKGQRIFIYLPRPCEGQGKRNTNNVLLNGETRSKF